MGAEDGAARDVGTELIGLHRYFVEVIQLPSTFEQLRTTSAGDGLRVLVEHLHTTCSNPAIVNGLL